MQERAIEALKTVIDPDIGINIVDLGLVERLDVGDTSVMVDLIMTSPACPQGDYLASQSEAALQAAFGPEASVSVAIVDFPVWGAERMSEDALHRLGWK